MANCQRFNTDIVQSETVRKQSDCWPQGVLGQTLNPVRQLFERLPMSSTATDADARYDYFVKKVWPRIKESGSSGTFPLAPCFTSYLSSVFLPFVLQWFFLLGCLEGYLTESCLFSGCINCCCLWCLILPSTWCKKCWSDYPCMSGNACSLFRSIFAFIHKACRTTLLTWSHDMRCKLRKTYLRCKFGLSAL